MANNENKKAENQPMKYPTLMKLIAAFAVLVGMGLLSIASFLQTMDGFSTIGDPEMILFGIPLGAALPFIYAIVFQYGQNVALLVREYLTHDKVIWENDNTFLPITITDTKLATMVFVLCAVVDAGTNILWMANNWSPSGVIIKDVASVVIGYSAMIAVVFVEEGMGMVAQAMSKSYHIYRDIVIKERLAAKNNNQSNKGNDQQQRNSQSEMRQERPEVEHRGMPNDNTVGIPGENHQSKKQQPNQNQGRKSNSSFASLVNSGNQDRNNNGHNIPF